MTDFDSPEPVNTAPPPSVGVAVETGLSAMGQDPPPADALRAEVAAEPTRTAPRPSPGTVEPGWYNDPADPSVQRYWAGDHWVGDPIPSGATPPAETPKDVPDGAVAVPLCGHVVHVIPRADWPKSAVTALRSGDFDTWAEKCLATDDDLDTWDDLDPTVGQVEDMFTAYGDLTGMTAGKAQRSRRSRRGGPRR